MKTNPGTATKRVELLILERRRRFETSGAEREEGASGMLILYVSIVTCHANQIATTSYLCLVHTANAI